MVANNGKQRAVTRRPFIWCALIASALVADISSAQLALRPRSARPAPYESLPAHQSALIDITGYWVAIVDQDWRWRMMTAPIGDTSSIPVNQKGLAAAKEWTPSRDDGDKCKAYGAAGLMRLPTRLHITWADDDTLQLDTDAGEQHRVFHFKDEQGDQSSSRQGYSRASWFKELQKAGFAPPSGGPQPGRGGSLKVITTHMNPGYLRQNGVPYSGEARLTEYFDRVEDEGISYLVLTIVVEDPAYLRDRYVTSYEFKLEPNGSKWDPQPCKVTAPTSAALPKNPFE